MSIVLQNDKPEVAATSATGNQILSRPRGEYFSFCPPLPPWEGAKIWVFGWLGEKNMKFSLYLGEKISFWKKMGGGKNINYFENIHPCRDQDYRKQGYRFRNRTRTDRHFVKLGRSLQ